MKSGYRVTALAEGEPVLELLTRDPPDLIVLDITLPGVDGLELCRRIRARSTSPEGKAGSLLVSGPGDDGWLSLRVVDEGPGILPEQVPRLFERFFTTDADRDRTGLGLAIVKSVASAHGGTISFTSEPGHGTCFELRLRAAADFRPGITAPR